jgi:hypothetical protein
VDRLDNQWLDHTTISSRLRSPRVVIVIPGQEHRHNDAYRRTVRTRALVGPPKSPRGLPRWLTAWDDLRFDLASAAPRYETER